MKFTELFFTNRHAFFLILWMAVAPLLFSTFITLVALSHENSIQQWPWTYWALFYLGTCFSMAFAFTPTTFIALLSGFFLGWEGLPFIVLAYLLASWIGYISAGFLGKKRFMDSIRQFPKAEKIIAGLHSNQFGLVVLSRISPVLPFAVMNVVLSFIGTGLKRYLWGGFLGMLPRTVVSLWIGSQAKVLKELLMGQSGNNLVQVSFILLLIVSVIGFYLYVKKIIVRRLDNQTSK